MRRLLVLLAAGVPLAATMCLPAGGTAAGRDTTPAPFNCSTVSVRAPAGTEVESVTVTRQTGGTVNGTGVLGGSVAGVPVYCEVTVTLTHPGDGDHAHVRTWLPEQAWNGRFQALGGSAYAAGDDGVGLGTAVRTGYAAATTDAGVGDVLDTGWALNSEGQVDTALLKNFADRSQHEMALVGKQVVEEVYGKAAAHSYWNGCSTGGRTKDARTTRSSSSRNWTTTPPNGPRSPSRWRSRSSVRTVMTMRRCGHWRRI